MQMPVRSATSFSALISNPTTEIYEHTLLSEESFTVKINMRKGTSVCLALFSITR